MANKRIAMRKIREVLRLCWDLRLGQSKAAEILGISSCTVNRIIQRAQATKLTLTQVQEMDDVALERLLYPPPEDRPKVYPEPDYAYIHSELRKKGVTLQLLWQEYKEQFPHGYQLSQFTEKYSRWKSTLRLSMRMVHQAGDKAFSDFAGAKFKITDPATGEVTSAHLFVSVLGASGFTFVDVYPNERAESWCTAQADAFQYFQGVPRAVIPDNPRSVVDKPCRYEPDINEAFRYMTEHFGCTVLPARVKHPKDKAKAELSVLLATRWIFARLRKRTFLSFDELRTTVRALREELNDRKFKKLPGSRRSQYEAIDRPALRPLPERKYEYFDIVRTRVGLDHHVEYEQHWYSVPYQLAKKEVELRVTNNMIEVLHGGKRAASHFRVKSRDGQSTTLNEHRPRAHREFAERNPDGLLSNARSIGIATYALIEQLINSAKHPDQAFNSAYGVLRLSKMHGKDRLEAACQRGLATGAISYKSIKSILSTGLDRRPLPAAMKTSLRVVHSNIRGADYFRNEEWRSNDVARTNDCGTEESQAARYDSSSGTSGADGGFREAYL